MLFFGYFPLIAFILFIFFAVIILSGELITIFFYLSQLDFLIEKLFSPAISFLVMIFFVSVLINFYFFIKISAIKNIGGNDKRELLYLFFKLPIFTSCFYVDVFIDKSRYTKFYIYLNMIRNILLGSIIERISKNTIQFFYRDLSTIEKSINSNAKKTKRYVYLILLFVAIMSFLFIFAFQTKSANELFPDFVAFFVIIIFLVGCLFYYTKKRK